MNRTLSLSAFLVLAVCGPVLLDSSYQSHVYAQSLPNIQQLFGFSCDANTQVCPDGKNPNMLIQSADGNFYGTTVTGGIGNNAGGAIFKITSGGQFTAIHTFVPDQSGKFLNGNGPTSLVEGNDGFLYGTAAGGPNANGAGVAFKLSKTGAFQVLHNFCSPPACTDSANPFNLILGNDGNFYGASLGVLWRMTATGSLTVLHTFNLNAEGPTALGMTLASDGNFYGTTVGAQTLLTTLFRLTPGGQFAILHTFHYAQFPSSAPVQGPDGALYGSRNGAAIFKVGLNGSGYTEFVLPGSSEVHQPAFRAGPDLWEPWADSSLPNGGIRQISNAGILLQTIPLDGANGSGPVQSLLQSSDGKILGVTFGGGSVPQGEVANGVVFTLDAGLPAPQPAITSFNPSLGKIGSQVIIHGSQFVGAAAITFNGVKATFQLLNTSNILATVPRGATTGLIAVTNQGGTAFSKKQFSVR